ncbi:MULTISPECIES: F0F1 ATP synthase subunit epsilon [Acaryochloris]|uniref:Alternate F1F0 ATPase, F1 subunit epsilon n=1 Tax=Acaryochloris marina (strain MBIC 11017) TaxID=329726 RepID=A8ZNR7_ACAM1|nr:MULTISPECIES: F0F1 ATP synthase subunit epsilon [Acaryochloris]ABW32653.1 alternate F1F0 ATPase, F1 subunit epsilon [Acaryochloris marina MBIC11017]KAI9129663.1 F0F1 ATP synthase subunit epsilon [Acaryochloris sp. CCMEE 5410]
MANSGRLHIRIFLPHAILMEQPVIKVTAESKQGVFCLLPHHIDCLAILVPGIVSLITEQGNECFVAVDEGILVKCGPEVRISTRNAIQGTDLGSLKQQVDQQFRQIDEKERLTRSALAQLEASLARYFSRL